MDQVVADSNPVCPPHRCGKKSPENNIRPHLWGRHFLVKSNLCAIFATVERHWLKITKFIKSLTGTIFAHIEIIYAPMINVTIRVYKLLRDIGIFCILKITVRIEHQLCVLLRDSRLLFLKSLYTNPKDAWEAILGGGIWLRQNLAGGGKKV